MASRIRDLNRLTVVENAGDRARLRRGPARGLSSHISERGESSPGFHELRPEAERLKDLVGGDIAKYVDAKGFGRPPQRYTGDLVELPFKPKLPSALLPITIKGANAPVMGARHMVLVPPLSQDPLLDYAEQIAAFYESVAPQVRTRLEFLFGLSDFGMVVDRSKSAQSVYLKLQRENREKREKKQREIENIGDAFESINDGYGLKVICRDATRSGMIDLLARLLKKLPVDDLRIPRIRHYTGPGVKPYLSHHLLGTFNSFLRDMGYQPEVKARKGGIKDSGYTSLQIDLQMDVYRKDARYPVNIDLHFRGPYTERVNDTEHLVLSILRQGRVLDDSLLSHEPLREVVDYLPLLSDIESVALDGYLWDLYRSARIAEAQGVKSWSPNDVPFPRGLPSIFQFSHIENVYREAKQIAEIQQSKKPK
jgi:hypothetical protein